MIFQNNHKHFSVHKLIYFKGSSGAGDTYDAAYNERMATIAESQQGMAEEYFDFWQDTFKPMETEQVQANRDLIPSEKALALEKVEAERENLIGQTDLSQEQVEAQSQLLPGQTQVLEAAGQSTLEGLEAMGGLRERYYDEVYNGLDPDAEATKAGTDASHAFAQSNEIMRRNAARMGINPDSGRFTDSLTANAIERSRQVGGASSLARFEAEKEQFNRLNSAVSQGPIQGISERPELRDLETNPTLNALDTYTAPVDTSTDKSTTTKIVKQADPVGMTYEEWLKYKNKYDDNNYATFGIGQGDVGDAGTGGSVGGIGSSGPTPGTGLGGY